MLFDIFSSFDDHNFVFLNFFFVVWGFVFLLSINSLAPFWASVGGIFSLFTGVFSLVGGLVSRSYSKGMGGFTVIFCVLFFFLASLNLVGLIPYGFSLTSHLAINLSISFPLWFSIVLKGGFYDLGGVLSHLQPMGSPDVLNPFLCLIELVSNLVRPFTLAVRLTANLSTGHILMSLLGLGFVKSGLYTSGLILVAGLFYFIFEVGVCVIQAYIFTLLPTLYADEHPSNVHGV